jgi:diaminopimelate decarboxylase/aspartate kinase
MDASNPIPFVVLKFGGTSVSGVDKWRTIANEARRRLEEGLRPLVVCSALSGVSNDLEKLVSEAALGRHEPLLERLRQRHRQAALEMGVSFDEVLAPEFAELERLALGESLTHESSPALQARILAFGELLLTRLGAAFLRAQGLPCAWLDARDWLVTDEEPAGYAARAYLSATCHCEHDPALAAAFRALPEPVLLTQGFIARDADGHTVLLGRGGSDTSASLFAARLGAVRCEIWTDVPGVYTANPRQVPAARLLTLLGYDEAQEIVSTGAKVLHPRCIGPVKHHRIPLHVRCTDRPDAVGTVLSPDAPDGEARVKAVSVKPRVTLISLETSGMWQQVGFLADVFAVFKHAGLSVDLVSTSEFNLTVTLDPASNVTDAALMKQLVRDLGKLCRVTVINDCAVVSLVGRHIRAILHRLGPALELFQEPRLYLVSQAASDLNLSFVVDHDQADRLVARLHELLFADVPLGGLFGPTWAEQFAPEPQFDEVSGPTAWWRFRRDELLQLAAQASPLYVYDQGALEKAARTLKGLTSVDRVLYAVKANAHPEILRLFGRLGLGFECVSPGELAHVRRTLPDLPAGDLLFTPNFASRAEYADALDQGVQVTLDNLFPLEAWPEIFRGRRLFVRIDPGHGMGHHKHVHTGGEHSKFGVWPSELDRLADLAAANDVTICGLHAHVGSGILAPEAWRTTAMFLAGLAERFPTVEVLDVGGGLGVPYKPGQALLDTAAVDANLARVRDANPTLKLWLEPGRFLVARAGVLLATVTQTKQKGGTHYVGVDAGMNTLIRPALYGSYHDIVNLTRLDEPLTQVANVVGPICESGDTLGTARRLPRAEAGDVLLIATAGAYGAVMSSRYNLREPAAEHFLAPR